MLRYIAEPSLIQTAPTWLAQRYQCIMEPLQRRRVHNAIILVLTRCATRMHVHTTAPWPCMLLMCTHVYAHTQPEHSVYARVLSFVSLGIHMTMVMRPLPEGFSAHNAIPLVTENGPPQLLVTCGLALFAFLPPVFFFLSISVIFTREGARPCRVTSDWRPLTDSTANAYSPRRPENSMLRNNMMMAKFSLPGPI